MDADVPLEEFDLNCLITGVYCKGLNYAEIRNKIRRELGLDVLLEEHKELIRKALRNEFKL